jgi:hypothetical protein
VRLMGSQVLQKFTCVYYIETGGFVNMLFRPFRKRHLDIDDFEARSTLSASKPDPSKADRNS